MTLTPEEKARRQEAKANLEHKDKYAFWETQPVAQFNESGEEAVEEGPLETKTIEDVRKEPLNLPAQFEWDTCDLNDDAILDEVFQLLDNNYVEDDDNMFRFCYAKPFLRWALQSPGYVQDWHLCVRVTTTRKMVGFITGIPAKVTVNGATVNMAEINFLCVHKKLRSKRLAPVLIKEITRRINLTGVWQASYTAGVVLPKPVASTRYWHRNLNPKKLIDVGFSRLAPRMTLARTIKLYKLPEEPKIEGIRPMEEKDVPQVTVLLSDYLATYGLHQHFDEDEVKHWLLPREGVINAHVVESDGEITDMLSFYTLPSTILGNAQYTDLVAAYMYYTVPGKHSIHELMQDSLILAKLSGHDVFNALDILENSSFLRDHKFGIGDGFLQYYLYNYRVKHMMAPNDVGLILL